MKLRNVKQKTAQKTNAYSKSFLGVNKQEPKIKIKSMQSFIRLDDPLVMIEIRKSEILARAGKIANVPGDLHVALLKAASTQLGTIWIWRVPRLPREVPLTPSPQRFDGWSCPWVFPNRPHTKPHDPFKHPYLRMNMMNPSNLAAYLVVFKKLQGGFNITSTQTPENAETRGLLPHPFLNCLDSTLRTPVQFARTASLVGATSQFIEKQHELGGFGVSSAHLLLLVIVQFRFVDACK